LYEGRLPAARGAGRSVERLTSSAGASSRAAAVRVSCTTPPCPQWRSRGSVSTSST
jgi:hypothetical protein